jgi:hypothetical protein
LETKSSTALIIGCIFSVVLFLIFIILQAMQRPLRPTGASAQASVVAKPTAAPGSQWEYWTHQDSMGRKRSNASVDSTNTLSFGFPYQGWQHGTLALRKSPGLDALIRIERGQFICGYPGCSVNVRFDDGPIQRFLASEPDDHSTTTLFLLGNERRFAAQLLKAKAVHIEATFYQEGSQILDFNVEGLKW